MPGKLLCLDIDHDSVSAVQVQSGLKGYRVLSCAHAVAEGEGSWEAALQDISRGMDLASDIYRVTIPADQASYRNLQMPFREVKKIKQTLPFEVESMIPFPVDEVVVDFLVTDRAEQSEILAVSLRKDYIKESLGRLKAYGIEPDLLEIRGFPLVSWLLKRQATPGDGLLLDIGFRRATMVFFLRRRISLVRSLPLKSDPSRRGDGDSGPDTATPKQLASRMEFLCRDIQNTMHAFKCANKSASNPRKIFVAGDGAIPGAGEMIGRFFDLPVEQINVRRDKRVTMDKKIAEAWNPLSMDHALALALREERREAGLNLLKDEFETKGPYSGLGRGIRKVSLALALVACFLMADLGVDYHLMKKRHEVLEEKITEVYRETFPEASRVVDPLKQMKIALNEVKGSSVLLPGGDSEAKVIDILRDISLRIPKSMDVHLTTMVINPENARVSGETDTFNTVDTIKGRLESSPLYKEVVISSANLDRSGKRVQFEVKMERKK